MGEENTVNPMLREWLRNERRLGVEHYAIPRVAPATPAAPRANPPARSPVPRPSPTPPTQTPVEPAVTDNRFLSDDAALPPLCTEELSRDDAAAALAQLDKACVKGCSRCRLCDKRTQTVFGDGHPRPELVFVGEGPGADEDAQGIPFIGRAGQLLSKMIAAMTLTREQVYICNIVKCRPPGNRTPTEDEMQTCIPYLFRQLAILRPKIIVCLGRPSSQTLLCTKTPISKMRGQFFEFPPPELADVGLPACKLMPTFHPAYLLRNPPAKKDAWEDLQKVMGLLGLKVP